VRTQYLKVELGKQTLKVPYVKIIGKKSGPNVCLISGVHGNEVTGPVSLWSFLEHAKQVNLKQHLSGTLFVFPSLNLLGLKILERYFDGVDLNRVYKDLESNTLHAKMLSKLVSKFFSKMDCILDFHDSGKRMMLMPHVRSDLTNKSILKLTKAFASDFIYDRKAKPTSLVGFMMKKFKIPVLTIESGGNFRVLDYNLRFNFDGIFNVLRFYKMYPGKKTTVDSKVFCHRMAVKSAVDGLVSYSVEPGDFIKKGQKLLELIDFSTLKSTPLYSEVDAYVLGLFDSNAIKEGQKLVHLVTCEKLSVAEKKRLKAELSDQFELVKISM